MPTFSGPPKLGLRVLSPKLEESLIKIHGALARSDRDQTAGPVRSNQWQDDWEARRARINQQLDLIEHQLSELDEIELDAEMPTLSLVGLPEELDEEAHDRL